MKKNLRTVLVLLLAVMFCGNANAQKGMHGIGVNVGGNIAGDPSGLDIGGGVKYQYNISNYVRVEPSFTFYSLGEEKSGFSMTGLVNMDVFFVKPGMVRPYLFAGVGFAKGYESYPVEGVAFYDESFGDVAFDAGAGLEWRVTHTWSLQIECGALGMLAGPDLIGCKFNIGLCYNF